ncbi:pirin family protein [Guyparkeria hydrothermalis]|uniref:pirin family protein n=1 Tax=Guyparkeria TaxID=2035712 RepID=UPI0010ABD92C|nr:pirin family protein [Guyparkeria sp. SB14A]MCL7750076.1 pirin family protein [Guyparkeria hydrothermalis]TKA88817.1 pirin family protein [Guyparkeria sp. SB14A]
MSIEIRDATVMAEGAGARVKRHLPLPAFMNFDPFVMFDHFELGPGTGFPEHPHRGFEAITYLFRGEIEHRDNLGNVSTVGPGGAQRFTAGAGIVHSEMPSVEETTSGIQLWVNLPRRLKASEPAYEEAPAETVPEVDFEGGRERRIAGEGGRVVLKTDALYRHVLLDAGGRHAIALPAGWRAIVYLKDGAARINGQSLSPAQAAFLDGETRIELEAVDDSEVMVAAGRPHGEPIRQRGPYVD